MDEQEQQLREIDQLLEASPNDESLLALKADILELIAASAAEGAQPNGAAAAATNRALEDAAAAPERSTEATVYAVDDGEGQISGWSSIPNDSAAAQKRPRDADEEKDQEAAEAATEQSEPPHKKKKKKKASKDFVIPPHLQPNDQDSTAEANRKKRTVKNLKSQWRAERKEQEANQKQKSWQSFQQKKKTGQGSMFATSTDAGAKVGVVGGRNMTENAARKRHK